MGCQQTTEPSGSIAPDGSQPFFHPLSRVLFLLFAVLLLLPRGAEAQGVGLTIVELNAENLFDTQHDTLKNDTEFLPDGAYRWTPHRYWQKLNRLGQTIISCGRDSAQWSLPDLVGLCEVENDTVMRDLTRRSLLRKACYEYVMTCSPDNRGMDVALLYSPFSFRLISSNSLRIAPPRKNFLPTRDVLYACGELISGDTLHVFLLHAPSRRGGEKTTRAYRMSVAGRLACAIDSIRGCSPNALIVAMGDFNDYSDAPALRLLAGQGMTDVSQKATGTHGARATYRYQGLWASLDHILVSSSLLPLVGHCFVNDAPFLLEPDKKYGGYKPRRNYYGPRYNNGFSDHLPLVLRLQLRP